jgi:hypothetical protein
MVLFEAPEATVFLLLLHRPNAEDSLFGARSSVAVELGSLNKTR